MEFDSQASSFDRRAGLPATACEEVAAAVLALTCSEPTDLCLEIGAGTGQIGQFLAARVRYLGLDASSRMLQAFRRRAVSPGALLLQGDADERWPLRDDCARVIFGSRVMHLLAAEHLAGQARRVAAKTGAWLLIGQVRRDPDGIKARLRRRLQRLLAERGFSPRARRPAHGNILAAARALGASAVPPRAVSHWHTSATAAGAISGWREKQGLAGLDLPAAVHREVLDELQAWAASTLGDLARAERSPASYWLQGARFGPKSAD